MDYGQIFTSLWIVVKKYLPHFRSVVPTLAALSGNQSEMEILRPHLRRTRSETLEVGLAICALTSLPGDSDAYPALV